MGLGPLGMILFGLTLGVFGNLIDAMVEWGANVLLAGISRVERKVSRAKQGSPAEESPGELPDADTRILHAKMVVAFVMLHATLAIAAAFAYAASKYFNGEQWGFGPCYYFAFASFSTIGFGDFAMGPTDDSTAQLLILHLQALVILVGLAAFNAFASIGADWVRAVADDVTALVRRLRRPLGSCIKTGPPLKVAPEPRCARVASPEVDPWRWPQPAQAVRSSSSSPLPSPSPPLPSLPPSPSPSPPPESHPTTTSTETSTPVAPFVPEDFEALVRVQALLRRWRGAREASARRVERGQSQMAQRAATHLQSAERGRMARKDVSERKHARALHMAAGCLQRAHRGRVMGVELPAERGLSSTVWTLVKFVDDTHSSNEALVDDTHGKGAQGGTTSEAQQVGPRRSRSGNHTKGEHVAGKREQPSKQRSVPSHLRASSFGRFVKGKVSSRLAQLRCAPPFAQLDVRVPRSVRRVPMGCARARKLTLRLLRAVLGMYAIMLCGGGLLYAVEAQPELDAACAGRAEENRRRVSMRLPPLENSDLCT